MTSDVVCEAVEHALGGLLGRRASLALAADGATWEAAPGEVLVAEGSPASQGYIIVRGTATVAVGDDLIARVGPGSLIWAGSEWGARPARVVADVPMWLLLLGPDVLRRLRRARAGLGLEENAD